MMYVYKGNGLYQKELYMNKRLVNFFKDLGHLKGVIPLDEAS